MRSRLNAAVGDEPGTGFTSTELTGTFADAWQKSCFGTSSTIPPAQTSLLLEPSWHTPFDDRFCQRWKALHSSLHLGDVSLSGLPYVRVPKHRNLLDHASK